MAHLITGYAGSEHIQSADDGAFNAAFFGGGQYVMESGSQFEGSIIDNNTVRVLDGDLLMYGRHVRIAPNIYEDMTIETGTAGKNRIDLICMTYEKNTANGTEKAYLEVVKGKETEGTAVIPSYTDGNILEGATYNQMPLYKVSIEGVVCSAITPVFTVIPTYKTLAEMYEAEFMESCENYLESLKILDTVEEVEANTKEKQLAGALALKEHTTNISNPHGVTKAQVGLGNADNTADANKTVKSAGICTGNSATATKLAKARTIALTGSVTGSGTFDGSGNLSITTATNHTHSYLPLSGGSVSGALAVSGSLSSNTDIHTNNTAKFYTNIGTTVGVGGQFYASGNNTYVVANNNNTQTYLQLQAKSAVQCLATGSETTFIPCKASSYPGSSSRRYKDNIAPLTEEEARKILDVETVTFDYKEGIVFDSERFGRRGVIADDVVNVIPSVVLYANIEGLGNVPDSVDYSKFAPYLIKMVQIQQNEINEQKETISDLLERIERLESSITTE